MQRKEEHLKQRHGNQRRWLIRAGIISVLVLGSIWMYVLSTRKTSIPPLPDTTNFTLFQTITDPRGTIWQVAFSPDGQLFAAYSGGADINLWRIDGSVVHTLNLSRRFAFSPDGSLLATAAPIQNLNETAIKIWGVKNGLLLQTFGGPIVESVAFNPDGRTLVSVGQKEITLWRVSDWAPIWIIQGDTDSVRSVTFSPDGRKFATNNQTATAKVYDAQSGTLLNTFDGQSWGGEDLAFSPNGQLLATRTLDGNIELWDLQANKLVRTLAVQEETVQATTFDPEIISLAFRFDGKIIAAGNYDGTVVLWHVADGTRLQTLQTRSDNINSLAFSPDGRILLMGSGNGTIELWHDNQ